MDHDVRPVGANEPEIDSVRGDAGGGILQIGAHYRAVLGGDDVQKALQRGLPGGGRAPENLACLLGQAQVPRARIPLPRAEPREALGLRQSRLASPYGAPRPYVVRDVAALGHDPDDPPARVVDRLHREVHDPALAVRVYDPGLVAHDLALHGAADGAAQPCREPRRAPVGPRDPPERPAHQIVARRSHDGTGRLIDFGDGAGGIEDRRELERLLEYGPEQAVAGAQLFQPPEPRRDVA